MKRYNHIKTLTAVLATALLLAACSKEPATQPDQKPLPPAALGVAVGVVPQTRNVVVGTSFSHGSRINIILQDAGATNTYQGISMPYEFQKMSDTDPGIWVPTATQGLLVSDLANVFAHYPDALAASEASLSSDKKTLRLTLPASRDFGDLNGVSTYESFYMAVDKSVPTEPKEIFICPADVDYMLGQGTQVSTADGASKSTTIEMKHLMAMIVVYVKRHPALTDSPDVKSITIRNTTDGTAPLKQGSYSLIDNTFTPNTTEAVYTRTMSGYPVDLVRYAMLVYPGTMAAGDVQMELLANKNTFTMPMPAKTWQAGRVYIYNVEISANQAQLQGVQLEDWPEWIDKPVELE